MARHTRGKSENEVFAESFAYAAEIDEGEKDEDPKTEFEGVRLERRYCRDQRAHSRRYAHCDVEKIVDHQGRSGEQAGVGSEVLLCDGVGTSSRG
jgi:hypothetical protein